MPRRKNFQSPVYPFHVYNRTIDREFYPLDKEDIWQKCCELLRIASYLQGSRIHCFTLMSNHYHLLATFPDSNMPQVVGTFQQELSRWLIRESGYQKYRFSGRYKASMITDSGHFLNVYRYIYNNPRRAGLVINAETYPYSTLAFKSGVTIHSPPLSQECPFFYIIPHEDNQRELKLINSDFDEEEITAIKNGLRKTSFSLSQKT